MKLRQTTAKFLRDSHVTSHVNGSLRVQILHLKARVIVQGRNMVYGLRAQSPKYDWDQGSEERDQGSEEWDQGSQGFSARIRDQIYYTV